MKGQQSGLSQRNEDCSFVPGKKDEGDCLENQCYTALTCLAGTL